MKHALPTLLATRQRNAGRPNFPFVGHNIPFIGHTYPSSKPIIGHNKPFVGIRRNSGFTLVELIVTLAIASILFGFAAPNFQEMILNNRIRSDTDELASILILARSEAVKRKTNVRICRRNTSQTCLANNWKWSNGFLMWVDLDDDGTFDGGDELLKDIQPSPNISIYAKKGNVDIGEVAYTPRGTSFGYNTSGTADQSSSTTIDFRICDAARQNETGREIDIGRTGRTKTTMKSCPYPTYD